MPPPSELPVVRPPVIVSPASVRSPVDAAKFSTREFCWASIESKACPEPVIVSVSVTTNSPPVRGIICDVSNSELNVIVSAPAWKLANAIASRSEIMPSVTTESVAVVTSKPSSISVTVRCNTAVSIVGQNTDFVDVVTGGATQVSRVLEIRCGEKAKLTTHDFKLTVRHYH